MHSSDQSIWSALSSLYGTETGLLESVIDVDYQRRIVLDYVWREMRAHGEIHPPFVADDDSEFIRSRRVRVKDFNIRNSHGMLIPNSDGFTLLVQGELDYLRRRGVIAHELGHTFLFDITQTPPSPIYRPSLKAEWRNVEGPAYEIGRQILLPEQSLNEHKLSPSVRNLFELVGLFQASSYFVVRRLVHDLGWWDACVLIAEKDEVGEVRVRGKFRGHSFKGFNISKNYNIIMPVLLEASRKAGELIETDLKVGEKSMRSESYCTGQNTIVCIMRSI